jgi:carboxymethylenebutenolidase
MQPIALMLALLWLQPPSGDAASGARTGSTQAPATTVEAAADEVQAAMAAADPARLETLLAPDFVAVDGRGGIRTRAQFLSDIRATPGGRDSARFQRDWTGVRTLIGADRALFVGRATWRAIDPEAPHKAASSQLITQHWRSADGRWQLVSHHSHRLPPPPEIIEFASGPLKLKGMLFRPDGPGPFPAIVYAHGNEPDPSDLFESVAPALVRRGYVVFGPHRRGSGLSAGAAPNLLRNLTEIERREGVEARSRHALAALEGPHLDDMAAAVVHAKRLPFVDPSRVLMIGNSFGGVLVMLAAERDLGLRGAADFAGGAINWDRSEAFRTRLKAAASRARIPLFLAQAANDFSTGPTRELGQALAAAGKPHRAKVYPAYGLRPNEGHGFGVDGAELWADEVLRFLETGK